MASRLLRSANKATLMNAIRCSGGLGRYYHIGRAMISLNFGKNRIIQQNEWSLNVKSNLSSKPDDFDNEFDDIIEIDPTQVAQERKGEGANLKYLIIDVREEKELENNFNLGQENKDWINIPKDIILNISDKEEFAELLSSNGADDLDEYQDLYFLCRGGVRSMIVAKHVVQLDLEQQLFNISGGITKYDRDVGLN